MTPHIPSHNQIDIEAVSQLVERCVAFANWAAGEGICPGAYKDPRKAEKNPDEFLYAYEMATHDDDWASLHARLLAAFKSLEKENGKLKCEINQYAWERDNARRERDEALAKTIITDCNRDRVLKDNEEYRQGYFDGYIDGSGDVKSLRAKLAARKAGEA